MKRRSFKRLLAILLVAVTCFTLASCGQEISIGDNGNWYIDGVDTGVSARGEKGDTGATGEKGDAGENGANGTDGAKGDTGSPSTVTECVKISSVGLVDTYRITFSNGQETTFQVTNGADGEDAESYTALHKHVVSSLLGGKTLVATDSDGRLKPSEQLVVTNNKVINGKQLTFTCQLSSMTTSTEIRVGHGKTEYASAYLVITRDKLKVVNYYTETNNSTISFDHGLEIKDFLTVNIDVGLSTAKIQIMTSSGMYETTAAWTGRQGNVFAEVTSIGLDNPVLAWSAPSLASNVWVFGDSYLSFTDPGRWPYYLAQSGNTDFCFFGYPGMKTEAGTPDFKWAVEEMGYVPQYAVWCLGMNNLDSDAKTANAQWVTATEQFLAICDEYGITPILSTTPTTPTRHNEGKNVWVRSWAERTGGRYIDFAKAVGADVYSKANIGKVEGNNGTADFINTTGYTWYDGMLYQKDCVHPAHAGAQALYMQVLIDFPEIMYTK